MFILRLDTFNVAQMSKILIFGAKIQIFEKLDISQNV